jgi:NAD(P)-dependent dehydrogenase (short-subunit alcohol dehydrogenase family)
MQWEIRAKFETNLFGLIRVTQAVLPIMRRQKSGIIVNISSAVGRFGYPGGPAYVSTKFAIEGLTESISYELEPFGIKVVLIEPGVIRTNIIAWLPPRNLKTRILHIHNLCKRWLEVWNI